MMEEKANMMGHRKLIVWQNLDKMEIMVQQEILEKIPKNCFQLRDQIDRACSSCTANLIEGYYSGFIKEYLRFLHYGKRSLAELQDWVRRAFHKKLVSGKTYSEFDDLSIKTMYLLNRLIFSLKAKISSPPKPSKPY